MQSRLIVGALLTCALAACGGGNTTTQSVVPKLPTTPQQQAGKPTAAQKISFTIPAPVLGSANGPKSAARSLKSVATRKPMYVSPSTAAWSLYVDGAAAITNASINAGTGSNTFNQSNGENATYTVTTNQDSQGSPTITVTATANLLPGAHTVGVVMTSADGFVLSENQVPVQLQGGANPSLNLYLQAVVDSAFWCDAACDGHVGTPDANGVYTLNVFPTDHTGYAIPYQTAGNTVVQLDNGPVQLVETDNNNIVSINGVAGGGGPANTFTDPGNQNTVVYTEGGQTPLSGWIVAIKCQQVGQTTVALRVGPNSHGSVTGFNYAALIDTTQDPVGAAPIYNTGTAESPVYTTANQLVGSVPTENYFGNELNVNCDAQLNMTVL